MGISNAGRDDLADALSSGSTDAACRALVAVVHTDGDADWLQSQCLDLLTHDAAELRGLAATCLGHIARLHGSVRPEVVERLTDLRRDPDVGGRADDALADIE